MVLPLTGAAAVHDEISLSPSNCVDGSASNMPWIMRSGAVLALN